jgi:hypothetical protein
MPKIRLALVACKEPTEGPWIRTRGSDMGVQVTFLGEGELILMYTESNGSSQEPVTLEHEGEYPLPECERIRFVKVCLEGSTERKPTSVNLIGT